MKQYTRKRKRSTSIYKGVTFHKSRKVYVVYVQVDGVSKYIGLRKREYDAGKLYDESVVELLGDKAITNKSLGLFGGVVETPNQIEIDEEKKICKIYLTKDAITIIDLDDYDVVAKDRWFTVYLRGEPLAVNTLGYRMHRVIMRNPKGHTVIHMDGNMLNNRKGNLELEERKGEYLI